MILFSTNILENLWVTHINGYFLLIRNVGVYYIKVNHLELSQNWRI